MQDFKWIMVPSILEKKLKLNYEEHSHFTLFMNTFSLPSSILSLHLFLFVLLLVTVMFSFVGWDVPQFIQFVLGHEAVLQCLVLWGSPCHRALLWEHQDGWEAGDRAMSCGSSCHLHPQNWHSWKRTPRIIFGSLSIMWKRYLLHLSTDLCTSWEVSWAL